MQDLADFIPRVERIRIHYRSKGCIGPATSLTKEICPRTVTELIAFFGLTKYYLPLAIVAFLFSMAIVDQE